MVPAASGRKAACCMKLWVSEGPRCSVDRYSIGRDAFRNSSGGTEESDVKPTWGDCECAGQGGKCNASSDYNARVE
jgi:hypothetical protein